MLSASNWDLSRNSTLWLDRQSKLYAACQDMIKDTKTADYYTAGVDVKSVREFETEVEFEQWLADNGLIPSPVNEITGHGIEVIFIYQHNDPDFGRRRFYYRIKEHLLEERLRKDKEADDDDKKLTTKEKRAIKRRLEAEKKFAEEEAKSFQLTPDEFVKKYERVIEFDAYDRCSICIEPSAIDCQCCLRHYCSNDCRDLDWNECGHSTKCKWAQLKAIQEPDEKQKSELAQMAAQYSETGIQRVRLTVHRKPKSTELNYIKHLIQPTEGYIPGPFDYFFDPSDYRESSPSSTMAALSSSLTSTSLPTTESSSSSSSTVVSVSTPVTAVGSNETKSTSSSSPSTPKVSNVGVDSDKVYVAGIKEAIEWITERGYSVKEGSTASIAKDPDGTRRIEIDVNPIVLKGKTTLLHNKANPHIFYMDDEKAEKQREDEVKLYADRFASISTGLISRMYGTCDQKRIGVVSRDGNVITVKIPFNRYPPPGPNLHDFKLPDLKVKVEKGTKKVNALRAKVAQTKTGVPTMKRLPVLLLGEPMVSFLRTVQVHLVNDSNRTKHSIQREQEATYPDNADILKQRTNYPTNANALQILSDFREMTRSFNYTDLSNLHRMHIDALEVMARESIKLGFICDHNFAVGLDKNFPFVILEGEPETDMNFRLRHAITSFDKTLSIRQTSEYNARGHKVFQVDILLNDKKTPKTIWCMHVKNDFCRVCHRAPTPKTGGYYDALACGYDNCKIRWCSQRCHFVDHDHRALHTPNAKYPVKAVYNERKEEFDDDDDEDNDKGTTTTTTS